MEYQGTGKKFNDDCLVEVPKATIRDEVQAAKGAAIEILARARGIKSFLIGAEDREEAEKRTSQCCQDELAEINRVLQAAIYELDRIVLGLGME